MTSTSTDAEVREKYPYLFRRTPGVGNWYVRVAKLKLYESAGTSDPELANEYALKAIERARAGKQKQKEDNPTVTEFWPRYLKLRTPRQPEQGTDRDPKREAERQAKSIDRVERASRQFRETFAERCVKSMDYEDAQGWVNGLYERYGPNTIRTMMAVVKSIFERAIDVGIIEKNPFRSVKGPRGVPKEDVLSFDDEPLLMKGLHSAETRRAVLVILNSGLRHEEFLNLQPCDITLDATPRDGGVLHVRHGKGDKPRHIWVLQHVIDALETQRQFRGLGPDARESLWTYHPQSLAVILKRACTRLNVSPVTVHGLRRTYMNRRNDAGMNERILKALVGHAARTVTDKYLLPSLDSIKAEVLRIGTPKSLSKLVLIKQHNQRKTG